MTGAAAGSVATLILVVQDDGPTAELMADRLSRAGYSVVVTYDGQLGLERYRDLSPAGLIIDLHLPGLDGLNLLRAVRENGDGSRPVVIVTSRFDNDSETERAFQIGADDFLARPFSPDELMARMNRYFPS